MTGPACPCGKAPFYSEHAARMALVDAKIRRVLRHNTRRRECRVYACTNRPGIWHLTSQPARTYQEPAA